MKKMLKRVWRRIKIRYLVFALGAAGCSQPTLPTHMVCAPQGANLVCQFIYLAPEAE